MADKGKKLFLLIDSNSIFHRAYHALPRFRTKKGELTNAAFGFTSVLLKALKDYKPDYMAAAFDVAGPTFREEEYEEYKATREKAPDELYEQIPRIKEMLNAFNVPIYEKEGFEADDVIGTVAEELRDNDKIEVLIVSGDLDTLQLVGKNTRVYTMKKSVEDTVVYDVDAVKERFGLSPEQLADYKGLQGDASDNIPGVPGIGEKTATDLLKSYPTLEELYEAVEKDEDTKDIKERIQNILKENKEQAFFSRMLATIRRDVEIDFNLEDAKWGGFDSDKVRELFNELEFKRLVPRLEEVEGFTLSSVEGFDSQDTRYKIQDTNKSQETNSVPTGHLPKGDKQQIKKSEREVELLQEVEEANEAGIFSEEIYKLEKDLVPVILDMEKRGIKVDVAALEKLKKNIQKKLDELEKKIYKQAGREFNVNSPQQLSDVLFEELEISPKGLKKTPGKKVSTAASELEKLRGEHPIIDLILQQRELQKVLSTYIVPLPDLVAEEDGRVHTTWKPLGTATGRMSSANPNLQNIPLYGEFAHDIRDAFVAEEGNLFLACDYSQMELRIVAHLADDTNMINAFRREEDIHTNTASLVFDVKKDDVTSEMRHRAKALNFGLIYGIGPQAFSRSADISVEEADEFMQRYMDVFSGVAEYMKETKEKAHQLGYVETMFGRKRFLPDLSSGNPMHRAMAERAAINMPVQGTLADIIKMAMVKAHRELEELDLILQIHDELVWEAPSDTIEKNKEKAENTLEDIVKLKVPLKIDSSTGASWGALEK